MNDMTAPEQTPSPLTMSLMEATLMFSRFTKNGAHPEYIAVEERLGVYSRRRKTNYWKFIRNAVDGTGGFANGTYLNPYELEIENSITDQKFVDRADMADYDNFARDIADAPWNEITKAKDLISRDTENPLLQAFWRDATLTNSSVLSFLEYPFFQARLYGTGWIFMDRPLGPIISREQDLDPATRPYVYSVPTQNVVDWRFDLSGNLAALVVVEPEGEYKSGARCTLRVWTRGVWARWVPEPDMQGYRLNDYGVNTLGEIPAIMLFNAYPGPKRAIGYSEMCDVARLSQSVYNIGSEQREIERKLATFLALPVKNAKEYADGVVIGKNNVMLVDGDAGMPAWISPTMEGHVRLDSSRNAKIASAYKMANLYGLFTDVSFTSGRHAEIEIAKTEKRLARHATTLEHAEMLMSRLFLKYYGLDEKSPMGTFTVQYPREFTLRDIDKAIARATELLALGLGEKSNREALTVLFKTLYPRRKDDFLQAIIEEAVQSIATQQAAALASGKPAENPSTRIKQLLSNAVSRSQTRVMTAASAS